MSPDRKLSRRHAGATAALIACWGLVGGTATAQPADAGVLPAGDLLRLAERAEEQPDFARAERLYAQVVERRPGSRAARRARTRLEWMRARRDDQRGYAPLEVLTRARRAELDAAALDRFAAEVDRMPPGRVRRESLFLLGETWFRRLGSPSRALPYYRELVDAPGASPDERSLAQVGLAEARAAAGDRAGAVAELERAGLGDTAEARDLRAAERRAVLRAWAVGLLGAALSLLLGAGRPWRAGGPGVRRALAPRRLLTVLYVVAVPAALSELYQRGTADTFLLFGAAMLPVLALAAICAESLRARGAGRLSRLLTAAGTIIAPVAVAYLVLERGGALASFGL